MTPLIFFFFFVMCNLGQTFPGATEAGGASRDHSVVLTHYSVPGHKEQMDGDVCWLLGGHGTFVHSLPESVMTNCIFDRNGAFCQSHVSFMDFQSLIFREVFF